MALARRDFLRLSASALTLPALVRAAGADTYPAQPVRIVVGFPAGGPVDLAARLIAPSLTERLGQPILIENHPGESGNLATRAVVRAAPDGYTLLLCGPVNTINTTLFPNLDFDFMRDLTPVAGLSRVPLVIEVHPAVEARNVPEFLALAKARPSGLRVAYAGDGTPQHVGIALFKAMAGVDLALVPYLGSAPALADLLAGRVDAMFDPLPSSIEHIRAGRLIPLAVTSPCEALPDVPTASRFVPGYEAGSWFGLVAPRDTAVGITALLNDAVRAALANPRTRSRLARVGAAPMTGSTAQFAQFLQSETARYADVIGSAGLRAQ